MNNILKPLFESIERDSKQLLEITGTGAVQLPIKGTDWYVIAGTLPGILSTAGKPLDESSTAGAAKPVGSIGDYAQFHTLLGACYEACEVLDKATGGEVFDASDKLTNVQNKLVDYINDWSARLADPTEEGAKVVPSRAAQIECALRSIIEADDNQELTQQLIEIGRASLFLPPATAQAPQTDELRAFLTDITQSGKDMNGSYWIPRAAKLLESLSAIASPAVEGKPAGLADERISDCTAAFRKWHAEVGDQDCEYTWHQAWCAALLATPAAQPQVDSSVDLHNAIMNLPCDESKANEEYSDRRLAYKHGHRDARHAAAELAIVREVDSSDRDQAQWISIDERLPEQGQSVALIGMNNWTEKPYFATARYEACDFIDEDEGDEWANVTHWMPLPSLPTVAAGLKQEDGNA